MEYDVIRKAIAEFLGTFALVLAVIASLVVATQGGGGLVGTALAQGFVLAIMVSSFGHISGGHFNPAVTLGFLLTRRIEPVLGVIYMVAQFAGAIAASLLLHYLYPEQAELEVGVTAISADFGSWEALILEALFTFFLVWVVFATAVDEKGAFSAISGFAIGLVLAVSVLSIGPITGSSINPARTFGPALVENEWSDAWIYYVGPFVGGAVAAFLYTVLYLPRRTQTAA
jgi:MIP family channel proteins